MRYAWIAVGGAAGSSARWLLGLSMAGVTVGGFPLPTLLANLAGSFALGFAFGRWGDRSASAAYQAATSGFLGAFTTMSAFGWEAWTLLSDGRAAAAAAYVAASALAGPLLAGAGLRAGAP
ncbi:fluoride efflux transporter FluC [Paenibacillus sp.]|uniref:fluoride efflux transporter FluC n=1 Tax=Paenibacillus sp. TaxID=58172 RepID=UPI002D371394|nr:CrcB family protein [Paenibacillus sp.]HZG54927.1 CrcB family protein [Paenibacillus sp.]